MCHASRSMWAAPRDAVDISWPTARYLDYTTNRLANGLVLRLFVYIRKFVLSPNWYECMYRLCSPGLVATRTSSITCIKQTKTGQWRTTWFDHLLTHVYTKCVCPTCSLGSIATSNTLNICENKHVGQRHTSSAIFYCYSPRQDID